jgi:hypothetical protein
VSHGPRLYRFSIVARTRYGQRTFEYEGRFDNLRFAERAALNMVRDRYPSVREIRLTRKRLALK